MKSYQSPLYTGKVNKKCFHLKIFSIDHHKETSMSEVQAHLRDDSPLIDHILALLHRESLYISSSTTQEHSPPLKHINTNRCKTLKWFYTIVAHFQYDREIVHISMDYLDRYILSYSTIEHISSRMYRLIAMTSLYLAIKLNVGNISPDRNIYLQEYAALSKGLISPQNIISMERSILETLNWRVHPVSPICFVRYFVRLVGPICRDEVMISSQSNEFSQREINECLDMGLCREVLHKISFHFTELTISLPETTAYFQIDNGRNRDTDDRTFAPSTIAYASILLSMKMTSYSVVPLVVRESFLQKCYHICSESHYRLQPNRKDIKELQVRLQKSFSPEIFLIQIIAENTEGRRAYPYASQTYPIGEAIHYGILNPNFFEGILTPRASLSQTSCITNPHISVSSPPRKKMLYKHSSLSPTSLLDKRVSFSVLPVRKRMKDSVHMI